MILRRQESPFPATSSAPAPVESPVLREIRRLLLVSSSVFLFAALFSYSPQDPSLSTWTTRHEIGNWMGRTGSVTADALFQLWGMGALFLSLLPFYLAFRRKPANGKRRGVGLAILFFCLALSLLIETFVSTRWLPWSLRNSGGLAGRLTHSGATFLLGNIGTGFAAIVACLTASLVLFQVEIFRRSSEAARGAWPAAQDRWGRLRAQWAALKESIARRFRKPSVASTPGVSPLATAALAAAASESPREVRSSLPVAVTAALSAVEDIPAKLEKMAEAALTVVTGGPVIAERVAPAIVNKVIKQKVSSPKNRNFQLPDINFLSGKAESKIKPVEKNWYLEKANILVQKLKDFGVEGEVVHISPGPVITVYEFKPASGVKIKEIANLSDDLTLALSALSVRIVAPIPGKPVVGIEIPSPHREMVYFKDLIQETPFFSPELKIPIVLGRLASGEPVASDLATMPHLLIAGSTGTGKSVFINTLICSLLYRFSPDQLKLILVDPKMVELSYYESIPHLLLPVVVDSKKAVLALRWAVEEMERRYTLMHQTGVRHVDNYNEKLTDAQKRGEDEVHRFLPYIVVVIDEYADLMAVVPKEVELSIARLAQKARASGIHLVLATQRPSTDVVTGTIKANFPSRISFRVASSIDSKTILDRTGSERLLGYGDLLFHSPGFTSLKRMQGPFLADSELNKIVEHLKSQGEPEYDEKILQMPDENSEWGSLDDSGEADENRTYDMAVRLVAEKGEASISLIQRHLRIGYNRAASIMERMEKEGVVGASTGPAKRRSVLVNSQ